MSGKQKVFTIINFLAFLATVIINGLANALPINNISTGEISDNIPNLFVPAGLTFAIWGLIYILLAFFVIYPIVLWIKKKGADFLDRTGPFFVLAAVGNIAWIFLWHYQYVALSLIPMLLLLASLLLLYIRLGIGNISVPRSEQVFIQLPISVYLGWITVATIANITAVLVVAGWDGFGLSEVFYTVLVIAVAAVITLLILLTRGDVPYSLVVIWAYIGIIIKRLRMDDAPTVVIATAICLAFVVLGAVISLMRRKSWYAGKP